MSSAFEVVIRNSTGYRVDQYIIVDGGAFLNNSPIQKTAAGSIVTFESSDLRLDVDKNATTFLPNSFAGTLKLKNESVQPAHALACRMAL